MHSTCASVPDRKTDAKDAAWLAASASFIPPQPQRDLRDLTRYRSSLKQERTRHDNCVHKLLEELLGMIDTLERAIGRLYHEIEERLRPQQATIERLDTITGVSQRVLETLFAEIG